MGCSIEVVLVIPRFRIRMKSFQVKLHEFMEGTQQQKSFFVELWDVGGSHSQRNTRHVFFHTVHGIILVHDLANRKSCHNLGRWLAEVRKNGSFFNLLYNRR